MIPTLGPNHQVNNGLVDEVRSTWQEGGRNVSLLNGHVGWKQCRDINTETEKKADIPNVELKREVRVGATN